MTDPDADLRSRLRALARGEHDDLSIGDEAAERLEEVLEALDEISLIVVRPVVRHIPAAETIWRICREALGTEEGTDAD